MKLIFADDTQLEVRTIYGGRQFVRNADRDVLAVEVDPAECTVPGLIELFQDAGKTVLLTTVQTNDGAEERTDIGTDYTLYLSASNEVREIKPNPGFLTQPATEEVNIVKIAQLTYAEKYAGDNAGLIAELENHKNALKSIFNEFLAENEAASSKYAGLLRS